MNTLIKTSDIASTALDTAGGFVYTTQFGLTTQDLTKEKVPK